ncbi:MAG: FAD-dependent oxidoreductase, partial [Deltaproteobacteria bacterium]|nr:FAD-dependent oxidoreductase [Deltaproteobacteria bacterium]
IGKPKENFVYLDKGMMATIGRSSAIAQTGRLKLKGFIAWIAWCFIHILYLIGFRNRLLVMMQWGWSYFQFNRGARLITRTEWKMLSLQKKHKPEILHTEKEKPSPI